MPNTLTLSFIILHFNLDGWPSDGRDKYYLIISFMPIIVSMHDGHLCWLLFFVMIYCNIDVGLLYAKTFFSLFVFFLFFFYF